MASRRMFSKDVVCSDRFLDMPASAQALYFQYGLEADDDGFVSAPKKILRLTNASDDDLKILVAKGFLIPFDSGVVVIRDWKINNYLRRDRYTPTRFKEEFEQLDTIDDRYQLHVLAVGIPDDNHVVDMRDTQVRLGKDSIGKGSINNNVGRKMSHFTPPTVEEVQEYCFERGNAVDAQSFVDFYQYFEDKIKEAGGNVVDGILLGILDALLGIGSWIVDNVFKPILDGFKNASVMLRTGMRKGEMQGLKYSDIDKKQNVIHVRRTLKYIEGKGYFEDTPKTRTSTRDIPLTAAITEHIEAQRKYWGFKVVRMDQYLFCNENGDPISRERIQGEIDRIIKRIKSDGYDFPRITSHVFRHTFATRAIEAGMPPQVLKTILGHSSLAMTMDLYSHVLPDTKADEMQKIANVF